jgi:hypothetical protein
VYDVYTGSSWIKSPRLDPATGGAGVLFPLRPKSPESGEGFSVYSVRLFDFPSERIAIDLYTDHGIRVLPDNGGPASFSSTIRAIRYPGNSCGSPYSRVPAVPAECELKEGGNRQCPGQSSRRRVVQAATR